MVDVFDPATRSQVMRAVKSRDTAPELKVRRAAHALGLRFRLQRRDLPGAPDLVLPRFNIALFVHGCFWHGHTCARGARMPAANRNYWRAKLARNMARDKLSLKAIKKAGWRPVIVWECETKNQDQLSKILERRILRPAFRKKRARGYK